MFASHLLCWHRAQLLLIVANVLMLLASALLLYAIVMALFYSSLFPLRWVEVAVPLSRVSREQLQYIVAHELRGTFFTVALDRTRQAFEKLPWVRQVQLRRRWPDRLEVLIEEHQALARWGVSGLLNQLGERFDAASDAVLPILEGPEGSELVMLNAYQLLRHRFAQIDKQPTRLWLSARHAWRVELDHQLIVEIGRHDLDARISRLVAAYPLSLATLQPSIDYIDLRYPNGFAVRLAEQQYKSSS